MEERSKTNKEIYEQLYPFKKVSQNPLLCAEAVGYLKALIIQYYPSEQKWVETKLTDLLMIMLFFTIK